MGEEPPYIFAIDSSTTILKLYEVYIKYNQALKKVHFVTAGKAENAFEVLEKKNVRVIILDWNLPGMNGLQFLEKLRREKKWKHIRVIMASTINDKKRILKAISLGANDYMLKPTLKCIFNQKIAHNLLKAGC